MKAENEKPYEERLLKVLAIVIDWLKFAEAKNAMLIAFNGASIYGLVKALELDIFDDSKCFTGYVIVMIFLLIISTLACLLAFLPQLRFSNQESQIEPENTSNIFFGTLKDKSPVQIIQGVCEVSESEFSPFELDLASQIKENSIVAHEKFLLFKKAIWITIFAYFTILTVILWLYIRCQRKK